MNQKVVVFEVGSSFGYFRKGFTTSSSLTHAVIPRSAVEGLIGAILGMKSSEYPEKLADSQIGVEILSPVKKFHMKTNFVHEDWWALAESYLNKKTPSKPQRFTTRIDLEYLVNPKYRIYFSNPHIEKDLVDFLAKHKVKFTPYLGTSSMIAWIHYVGEYTYQKLPSNGFIPVNTVIPYFEKMPVIKMIKGTKFAIEEGLPIHLSKDRKLSGNYNAIYNVDMKDISVKGIDIKKIKMKDQSINIVFLPTSV